MTSQQQKNKWVQQFLKNALCPHGCGMTIEKYQTEYEGDNCDQITTLYWHRKQHHRVYEVENAKIKIKEQTANDISKRLKNA